MKAVLDASALLAWLQDEPGSDVVEAALHESCISSVNWAEVIQKSIAAGVDTTGLCEELEAVGVKVIDFTTSQADAAGKLWKQTRRYGLSLGDRACLSLAIAVNLPALTTDRDWRKIKLPIDIQMAR